MSHIEDKLIIKDSNLTLQFIHKCELCNEKIKYFELHAIYPAINTINRLTSKYNANTILQHLILEIIGYFVF